MAYLTGAVSLTAAPGREYAPTQCFFPGVADVTVTSTTSCTRGLRHPCVTSQQFGRQETVNPAVLRRDGTWGQGFESERDRSLGGLVYVPKPAARLRQRSPEGACVWGWEKEGRRLRSCEHGDMSPEVVVGASRGFITRTRLDLWLRLRIRGRV